MWITLSHCAASNDTCLANAQAAQLQKLGVTYAFHVVGADTSGQITHRANQKLTDEILARLNWKEVSKKLAQ